MPGWPGGLGNRLQDGRAAVDQGLGDRLQNWWKNTTFFKPAYDELVGGATMFGDVMSGAQPTMAADPQTGEFHTDPRLINRTNNAAGMLTLGAGAIPAEANSLRTGITTRLHHGSPRTDLQSLEPSTRGPLGPGVYTSPNEGVAGRYAGSEGKTYALPERERDIFLGHGHRTDEEWAGFKRDKERLLAAAEPEKKQELSALLDRTWSGDGYPTFARISQMYGGDAKAHELFKRAGFEGLSGQVDGPEVLLFGKQGLGIRAYHGSPHDFERFDASKIGTGEGAQAYGHGMYFAESPEVADVYKEMLTTKHNPADQQMRRFLTSADENAPGEVLPEGTDFGSILGAGEERASISNTELMKRSLANLERVKQGKGPLHAKALQRAQATVDYLKNNPQARFSGAPYQGRMYEVDIAADPEHFLDWDKPLSEQSPKVREAMAKAGYSGSQGLPPQYSTVGYTAGRELQKPEETALLREHGIPGIKYLDQGSRAKGSVVAGDGKPTGYHNIDQELANVHGGSWEAFKAAHPNPNPQLKSAIDELDARGGVKFNREAGTSNYVVFPGNEHLIAILKKYGLPISAAGLAALSQLHPQEAQAQPLGDRLQGR